MADIPISLFMSFAQFSKVLLGLKTLGRASKTTMVTTTFFKEIRISGSLGGRWFTPFGQVSNWETFLGRFFSEHGITHFEHGQVHGYEDHGDKRADHNNEDGLEHGIQHGHFVLYFVVVLLIQLFIDYI